ncbi:MAG: hypothetical protein LUF32_07680 [Clostridiales bacterium]|nr:hypothetical protein [Clostridiales bacterium]
MSAVLKSIQIFKAKGEPGTPLAEAEAVLDHGLAGDRHCMDERNPISLSDAGLSEWNSRQRYDALCFHRFKTNLTLENFGELSLKPGDLIRVGDQVVLEICSSFKKCYREKCELYNHGIPCPLPACMLFAVCRTGGVVREGDAVARIPKK